MAKSGSNGSDINVAQMVALVGQQIIGGQRVPTASRIEVCLISPKTHDSQLPKEGLAAKLLKVQEIASLAVNADGEAARAYVDKTAKVSATTLRYFIRVCLEKFHRADCEPDYPVSAIGARSISEPETQMTLKIFHFVSIASVSITQCVPRIKKIINASRSIGTPVVAYLLLKNKQIEVARVIKTQIEETYLSDILNCIEVKWQASKGSIIMQVTMSTLADLQLSIGVYDVARVLLSKRKLKIAPRNISVDRDSICIRTSSSKSKSEADNSGDMLRRANLLCRELRTVPISGFPEVVRALEETSEENTHRLVVEGYGLRSCMNTEGVVGTQTCTNSVMECVKLLGIEAARTTIADGIKEVMGYMGIDPRHIQLLADVMTYKREVLGITRFGLAKANDSVLHLASFEKVAYHLFDAVAAIKSHQIKGASESINLGQLIRGGTETSQVMRRLGVLAAEIGPKPTLFKDAWNTEVKMRSQRKKTLMAPSPLA
ncbi:DNA-directed RNA polymerase III subunit C1 (rpo31) [Conoideocrella luteorostrata]|uniref:DNA-directed RNA polymerase n=1 Tax=Conoideocrella luteorostrata TaxID=1105319 RepID=A0AAJ0FSB3_9HYPO|nr:DNA-directed RNA polymerase III subunit C1 (rpo31) [Conoideocrella luteorostrata]